MKAMYIGSFDPFTLGHLKVVSEALNKLEKVFKNGQFRPTQYPKYDKLIICVGNNEAKMPMFTTQERKRFIELAIQDLPRAEDITVISSDELTVDIARQHNIDRLIRGTRLNSADIFSEEQLAETNAILGQTRGISLTTDFIELNSKISSTTVRQLLNRKEYIAARLYLPQRVFLEILKKELRPIYEKAAKSVQLRQIPQTWNAYLKQCGQPPLELLLIAYQYNMYQIYEKHTVQASNNDEITAHKEFISLSLFLEIYLKTCTDTDKLIAFCKQNSTKLKETAPLLAKIISDISKSFLSLPHEAIWQDYLAYFHQVSPQNVDENLRQDLSLILRKKSIFHTKFFNEMFEKQTREILTKKLNNLQK